MELTWVANTPQVRSRTRAPRACASCQRRKKRCNHFWSEIGHRPDGHQHEDLRDHRPSHEPASLLSTIPGPSVAPRAERFVGDLNPEAVIRERLDGPSAKPFRDRIGLWVSSSTAQSDDDGGDAGLRPQLSGSDASGAAGRQPSELVASFLQQRYDAALQACERLPLVTRDRLVSIYFSRVNHILPLVDKFSFLNSHSDGTASVFLERAICLVAAKDPAATQSLRLVMHGPILSIRQFCSEIYKGLVVAMNAGLEPDRITGIRILALMSLHHEGYDGAEAASMNLCQAIHLAQTAGLHLNRPGQAPGDALSNLFWCLWTLDKLHASIGGRPIILADRDIGIEKPDTKASMFRSAFDIWLTISDLLSTVISFYRPSADHNVGWEGSFPTFEQVVGDNVRDELDFTTLGVLEMYYHAVGILSCRPKSADRPDGMEPSYIRQGLAAVRIYSIIASECSQGLPPLPIVPYALSLSMGVSYQHFRSSKLITHFERAKVSIEACCSLLEALSVYWYSAEAMARLGRKALHHIEGFTSESRGHGSDSEKQILQGRPVISLATSATLLPSDNHAHGFDVASKGPPGEDPSTAPTQDASTLGPWEPATSGTEAFGNGSFADIDMLFGDFLDLSLPTNFWDPVFFTPDNEP